MDRIDTLIADRADPGPRGCVLGGRALAVPGRRLGARPAARRSADRPRLHHRRAPARDQDAASAGRRRPHLRHRREVRDDRRDLRRRRSSRSPPTAPRSTSRARASRRSSSATRSTATSAAATSRSTRWRSTCGRRTRRPVRRPGGPGRPAASGPSAIGRGRFAEDPLRLLRGGPLRRSAGVRDRARHQAGDRRAAPMLADDQPRADRAGDDEDPDQRDRPGLGIHLLCDLGPDGAHRPRGAGDARHAAGRQLPPQGRLRAHPPGGRPGAADRLVRWAALLHDIAKPRTRTVDDGVVHFFGHEYLGDQMARKILAGAEAGPRHHRAGRASWWRCTSAPTRTRTTGPMARSAGSSARPATSWKTCSTSRPPTSPASARSDGAPPMPRVSALRERIEQIRAEEEVEKLAARSTATS